LLAGYILPATGTYLITARSYQPNSEGAYTLELNTVEMSPIAYNSQVEGEMADSSLYYTFDGKAGDVINARLNSGGAMDTLFNLRSPEGYIVQWDDDSGDLLDPEFRNVTLDHDGMYTLVIQPAVVGTNGNFTLIFDAEEPESIACAAPQAVVFSAKRQQAVFRFDVEADATYQLTFSLSDGVDLSSANMRILENGSEVSTLYGDAEASEFGTEFTAAADGEGRVIVSDYAYRNHAFTLTLACQ
jgi:hypothetical protein